jgi:hypothetical protein
MREQDFYIDFAETVLFVFAFSLLSLVIARGIGFWRYTGRLWFPTRSVRIGFSVLCCSGVFFGLIGIGRDPIEYFLGLDFPDFTRHLLAWKNSLLQTALEKHLQCDYVV